jgi:hypothetical protein
VIGYNPKMVDARDAPRSWDDFLDPNGRENWHGSRGVRMYAATLSYWGREKAQNFTALGETGIHWNRGHTMISQLMAAGEFPLGLSLRTVLSP